MKRVLLLLLLMYVPVQAATYWVHPNGLNTNDGMSPSSPWKTLVRACTALVAGDTVRIGPGTYDMLDTDNNVAPYTGTDGNAQPGLRPKRNGTAGSPIVFRAWPDSARPRIRGRHAPPEEGLTQRSYGAWATGKDYIVYDSIWFNKGFRGVFTVDSDSLIIKYCKIDSMAGWTGADNVGGIMTYLVTDSNAVRWLTAYRNDISEIGDDGQYYQNAGNQSGIHIYACKDCLIRENTIYRATAGIYLKGDINKTSILRVTIENNVFHSTGFQGAIRFAGQGGREKITARFNTVYNAQVGFSIDDGGEYSQDINDHKVQDIYLYNNTVDCSDNGLMIYSIYGLNNRNIQIFNNIFYRPITYLPDNYAFEFRNSVINQPDNCCTCPESVYVNHNFYTLPNPSANYFYWKAPSGNYGPGTFAGWKNYNGTACGLLAGQDANSKTGDPYFIDRDNRNYAIPDSSPAATGGKGGAYPTYMGAYDPGVQSFRICVDYDSLVFETDVGTAITDTLYNTITDCYGSSLVCGSITKGGSTWLAIDTGGDTLSPIVVAHNVLSGDTIPVGIYYDTVTVTCADADNSPLRYRVKLIVNDTLAPFNICIDSTVIHFQAQEGQSPASKSVYVSGCEAEEFTCASVSKLRDWLTVSTPGGQTTPFEIVNSASTSALNPGTYYDTVTVSCSGADNTPQRYEVVLVVTEAPPQAESQNRYIRGTFLRGVRIE